MTADKASAPADGLVERLKKMEAVHRAEADNHRIALQSCALAFESDFQQWLKRAVERAELAAEAAATITRLSADLEEARGERDERLTVEESGLLADRLIQAVALVRRLSGLAKVDGWATREMRREARETVAEAHHFLADYSRHITRTEKRHD